MWEMHFALILRRMFKICSVGSQPESDYGHVWKFTILLWEVMRDNIASAKLDQMA